MVNLDKGRVSLAKGQSVSLVKTGAPPLTRVRMGLGWDTGRGEDIDLDASCILYDARKKDIDKVWFMSKKGDNGNVATSGDNLTGAGEGDDEVIKVDLDKLSSNVQSLVFVVNSFSGQKFTAVRNAFCRLDRRHVESGARALRPVRQQAADRPGDVQDAARAGRLGDDGDRRVPRRQDRARDGRPGQALPLIRQIG